MDIAKLDRRWLYLMMAVVIIVPFVAEIEFPIIPATSVRKIYDAVEALEPGSVVLLSADYDPGSEAELYPMNVAIFHHLAQKDVRVVLTMLWPQAPPLVEQALDVAYYSYGKKKNVDIANLGYKPGGPILISKCKESFAQAFKEDIDGTPVEDVPAMKGIENFDDIDLFLIISAGTPGIREWLEQCQSETGKPMASGMTAVSAPDFFQYVNSGQMIGILGGLRGAADYEELVGKPDRGVLGMGPQSFGHMLIVLFIVLGNIGYLMSRRRARRAA
ncbi:MAG: hypothetical protein ACYTDY_14795 [Planctomycetota bacterium]|jgi:hypothetical protein